MLGILAIICKGRRNEGQVPTRFGLLPRLAFLNFCRILGKSTVTRRKIDEALRCATRRSIELALHDR